MPNLPQLNCFLLYQAVHSWLKGVNPRRIQVHLPLVAAYIAGLLWLGSRASCMSMAAGTTFSHDALNRLLSGVRLCGLLQLVALRLVKRKGGYLVIDDIVMAETGKKIEGTTWLYSPKLESKVMALNVVVLGWTDGKIYFPLTFRFWKPPATRNAKTRRPSEKSFDGTPFRTKLSQAVEMLEWAKRCQFEPTAVLFDSYYLTKEVLSRLKHFDWQWISRMKENRVFYHELVKYQPWQWHELGECGEIPKKKSLPIHLPGWGAARLVKSKLKGAKEPRYLAASNPNWGAAVIERLYGYRWKIETSFRDGCQNLALDACQCRKWRAQENHVALSLLAYCFTAAQAQKHETIGKVILRLKSQPVRISEMPQPPKVRQLKPEFSGKRQKPHDNWSSRQCA